MDPWLICIECGAWFERPTGCRAPKTCSPKCAYERKDWQTKLSAAGITDPQRARDAS